ncbi:kinesin-like protein unc-104 isoform X1 [Oryzias latipes]
MTAAMNTNAAIDEGAQSVKVEVVLTASSESLIISEDGCGVEYKPTKAEDRKSFTFDKAVTAENIELLHSALLQTLSESMLSGFNASLLACGASTEMVQALNNNSLLRKILTNLFSCMTSHMTDDFFVSVSFLQFFPDGSTVDLFNHNNQTLQPLTHPVLGSFVGGLSEVSVCSAEEAYALYETCMEAMKTNSGAVSNRCSALFSVLLERKLHPEQEESEESDVCRSRLQLFHLAGGASRTDLRGLNPLVKTMDQIHSADAVNDNLLLFLLKEALTGNNRTFLIYCINPAGLLDDETPAALDLAQKTSRLVTKSSTGCWSPKAAEREIREQILDLQNTILSRREGEVSNIYKLAELTQILQAVKNQSWGKRKEESERIKIQFKQCYNPSKMNQLLSRGHPTDHTEITQTVKRLQDQLRQEMEEHIKDGKGSIEKIQERVMRMKQLKEILREETLRKEAVGAQNQLPPQSQLEHNEAQQRRRQLKEDHGRLIQEEVEKMERDLALEQLPQESPMRELQVLSRERQVLVLQIEALRAEAQQAERDLEDQHDRHQTELQCLKEESLQVFRMFRQVCEEQRKLSESRYRGVLLEAVHDAVYLSAQNQQLQADNQHLRKALGEIKDALAARGDPIIHVTSQQQ